MASGDIVDQIVTVFDIATVDRDKNVARLNASLSSAAVWGDHTNDHAVGEPIDTTDCRGLGCLKLDTDGATNDFMFGSDEHVVDVRDDVGRHREPDTLRTHRLGIDSGVHADNLTCHIDERPAGVAGVNGGISLDKALKLCLGDAVGAGLLDTAVFGGYDACRHCLRQ